MALETLHLRLMPLGREHLEALMKSRETFEQQFGMPAAPGFGDFFQSGMSEVSPDWLARVRASAVPDPWLHGFAFLHVEDGVVIGSGGFPGPPEGGVAEIAYGIVPGYQGRGYATEAAKALRDFAFADERVRVVCAHTLAQDNASAHVLENCGFTFVGQITHPEDGVVCRWEARSPTLESRGL